MRSEFSTSAKARWTILSSSEAMPSARSLPSGFGMNRRREGFALDSLHCEPGDASL